MSDLMRLPKSDLVAMIGRLSGELGESRAGESVDGAVQRRVALWLLSVELPPGAEPVAALADRLARSADLDLLPGELAQVARELRATMAELREMVPGGDDDDEAADPLDEEVARLQAG